MPKGAQRRPAGAPGGRRRRRRAVAASKLLGVALVVAAPAAAAIPEGLDLELVVDGLDQPLAMRPLPDASGRLLIAQREGTIVLFDGEGIAPTPFLDITDLVDSSGQEQGLLGLELHPAFAANGELFVNYVSPGNPDTTIVARLLTDPADPVVAQRESLSVVLAVPQDFGNHNGGDLHFGPDGYLYVGLGDGGSGGDPFDRAQDLGSLLGKMLRLDVDGGSPYAVPADNPFIGEPGRDEIWAYGLRNPWRFSFDRGTGDLFMGDVGQNAVEEIDLQPQGAPGGENYGWDCYEGSDVVVGGSTCGGPTVAPILEYRHGHGCAVTGGYRYRGQAIPDLFATYVYGDFCSGKIWLAEVDGNGKWNAEIWQDTPLSISSFGEDVDGELYVVDMAGALYRFVAPPQQGDPPPPPGAFLTSPELPDFRFKVRITDQQGEVQASQQETDCMAETLCISGAVPGRSELFVRIVGPKPNGRLWPNLIKFSTSTVELWVEQLSTRELRYYLLEGASPGEDSLDGLFDRQGFAP